MSTPHDHHDPQAPVPARPQPVITMSTPSHLTRGLTEPIHLIGTGLQHAIGVWVGGVDCTSLMQVESDTSLYIQAGPALEGNLGHGSRGETVEIVVSVGSSLHTTNTRFHLELVDGTWISHLDLPHLSVAEGGVVIISGSGLGGVTHATFGGVPVAVEPHDIQSHAERNQAGYDVVRVEVGPHVLAGLQGPAAVTLNTVSAEHLSPHSIELVP